MSFLAFSHSSPKLQSQLKIVASKKSREVKASPTAQTNAGSYDTHAYPVGIVTAMLRVVQGESTAIAINHNTCRFWTTLS
jgi:hypothetical protein